MQTSTVTCFLFSHFDACTWTCKKRNVQCQKNGREQVPSFDALEYVVCLGDTRFSQVNNGPRANVFPAGEANFGQAMSRSLERATQDTRDGFDFYSVQASFAWRRVDVARLLRRGVSRPFWIISFEFVKVFGIRFCIGKNFKFPSFICTCSFSKKIEFASKRTLG